MRNILIIVFLLAINSDSYSQGKCTISVTIDCPKSDKDYWSRLILVTNKDNKLNTLFVNEKLTLPHGTYKFEVTSEFGDNYDTIITLDKKKINIVLKINWSYIFKEYSNSVFETEGDTIKIYYNRMYPNGSCASYTDRDNMELHKTATGQYHAFYFDPIIVQENRTNFESKSTNQGEKLLSLEKTKIIQDYFSSYSIPYDRKKHRECIVNINKHIYVMNYDTYIMFREELLKQ